MTTEIAISRLHWPIRTLGPGERVGIWMQGCSIRCMGCVSMDTWSPGQGVTTVEAVVEAIQPWLERASGITISGGEPFDQPKALIALLRAIRAMSAADILVFTGHSREAIAEHLVEAKGLLDALISDPFDHIASQTLPLRGSDNQRLHVLTPLGALRFAAYAHPAHTEERHLDLMFDDDGTVWLAGIPRRGDIGRLQRLLEAQGHRITISADDRQSVHDVQVSSG